MKTQLRPLFLALLVALLIALPARSQTTTTAAASQPQLTESLSTLPGSETIVYVNASRIINDALPRLVPEKDLQGIRSGIESLRAFANIDLRNMEFMVIALRFNKPAGGQLFPLPEAMFAARGDFDAKALINMATAMSEGKLREEKFGNHNLSVLKLSDLSPDAMKNPFAKAFSEIAITTLDDHTLAVGNLSYIKAALEAADGGAGRIKPETLSSLLREPNTLVSITGSPFMSFAKSFGLRMAENPDPNCMTRFGDFYVSLNMDAQNFRITGAMNADNPDTAVMVKNMLSGILQETKGVVPDKNAQSIFDQVKLFAEGSEVMVEAIIPQEVAAKFIREMFAPKPPPKPAATDVKTETAQPVKATKPTGKKPRSKK